MKLLTFIKGLMYFSIASFFLTSTFIVIVFATLLYENFPEYEARWYKTFENGDNLVLSINEVSNSLMLTLPILSEQVGQMNDTMGTINGTMYKMSSSIYYINGSVAYMAQTIPPQMGDMNNNMGRMRNNLTLPGMAKGMFPW